MEHGGRRVDFDDRVVDARQPVHHQTEAAIGRREHERHRGPGGGVPARPPAPGVEPETTSVALTRDGGAEGEQMGASVIGHGDQIAPAPPVELVEQFGNGHRDAHAVNGSPEPSHRTCGRCDLA